MAVRDRRAMYGRVRGRRGNSEKLARLHSTYRSRWIARLGQFGLFSVKNHD